MNKPSARIFAFYLPQFHPIPENDEWWGKGFTEWTNVGKARSLYPCHYQPKVPADLGFYDLRVPETREAQAEMARQFGIEGFCYWHYWFGNGKRLLERPFNEVLTSGKPDFPFCLAWANESWRGFFHGIKTKETLIEQLYPGKEDYIAHFKEVLPAFKDKRYITVDGKPLFMIYHPLDNKTEIVKFMNIWQELALQNGLKGIYFVGQTYNLDHEKEALYSMGFDAINDVRMFQYEWKQRYLYRIAKFFHDWCNLPYVVPYKKACKWFTSQDAEDISIIPTIIPNWDHSPRSGKQALIFHDSHPRYFESHMKDVMSRIKDKPIEHRIAFVKSWNEWAEGNYLEPDLHYGTGYLEVIKRSLM